MARNDAKKAAANSMNDAITRVFGAYSDREALQIICNTIINKVPLEDKPLKDMDVKELASLKTLLESKLKQINLEVDIRAGLIERK